MNLKKIILSLAFLISIITTSKSQSVGVSYFLPEKGYLSIPISPFYYSFPINITNFIGLTITTSLYSIGGMNLKGLDNISSSKPLIGPIYSSSASLSPKINIYIGNLKFSFLYGVFAYYNISQKIYEGNIDRMFLEYEDWSSCTGIYKTDNHPGWGWVYGTSLTFGLSRNVDIVLGVNYYNGSSDINLKGKYYGAKYNSPVVEKTFDFPKTKLLFRGYEFSAGIEF